jgi:hypothetical protein
LPVMNNKVFAIIGRLEKVPDKYMFLGTGFFIDSDGFFVTAGHVFRRNRTAISQFYICFPEDKGLVELINVTDYRFFSRKIYGEQERLHNVEWDRYRYQCGREYFDVGVGKVDIGRTEFHEFKKKRPYIWDKLEMPCYNRDEEECPEKNFLLVRGKIVSKYIEYNLFPLELKERLRLARIPFLYEDMEFENIDLYNNCIEVYGDANIGNSGAPVINEMGMVIGIYITGTSFNDLGAVHLARYVRKKTNVLKKMIIKQR